MFYSTTTKMPINTKCTNTSPSTCPTPLTINHSHTPFLQALLLTHYQDFLLNNIMVKVVIKVSMNSPKSRSKAMKIAVGVSGVETAAIQGENKDQIAVTGERIDSVCLTSLLRKSFGHAELVSVGSVEEKKEEGITLPIVWPYVSGVPQYPVYDIRHPSQYQEPNCSIM